MSSFFCESSESPTRKNKNVHTFSVYLLLPSKKVTKEKSWDTLSSMNSPRHISRICQISALSGNILPFMSSLHFWHFCKKIHRFTLIGIFDNDSLLRALSKTENRYFKTICFRYGTSQHIIKHRKIVVNNTNQSKSMDFSTKMPKMKTTHECKNVS